MKKLSIYIFASLIALSCLAKENIAPTFAKDNDPKPNNKKWELVKELSDEFSGTELDPTKWTKDPVSHGWQWPGRPYGLFTPEAVQVKDGAMTISVGLLPDSPRMVKAYNRLIEYRYFGGMVHSLKEGKVGYYFECKMKMSKTEMGGGFWMTTKKPIDGISQEIDVVECVGKVSIHAQNWAKNWANSMNSNTHHHQLDAEGKKKIKKNWGKAHMMTEKNSDRYFVYGVWRKSPTELLFYLDGKLVNTINPEKPMDLPCFVNISIECYDWNKVPEDGGAVVHGKPEDKITYFDWVRVWKLK